MSIMDSFFQRTLDDLIKSLRLALPSESTLLSKSLEEIRKELKSTDLQTKSIALEKLTYLNSLHSIDMNFASFHVVEVMSSPKFSQKRIGYLAASQSFHEDTDVILLITNQLRKDLTSSNEFEVSLAIECLSVIATHDLARDLMNEIFVLLASSKIFVKKKAIGVVLRVFGKYPDSVKVVFKRLVENLENSSSGNNMVMSAVIGVFCELSMKDPKSYLPLAPEFYRILVDSKNNWVLIKVLKIFSKLGVLEPRLAKRIVEPICDLMRRTTAKSLMFECIRTVVSCLSDYETAVKLAVEKVRELLNDEDPNLKYLGLKALSILGSKHLWAVVENKEVVIKSLSDADPNIRNESLNLVMEMVSEDNVVEISRVLLNYALKSDPDFSNKILASILSTCGRNDYEVIVDFEWYVSFLGEMVRNPHCQKGVEIEHQFVDIGMRVKEVRPELVHVVRDLLIDPALLGNPFLHRILSAAAWVSGEYVEFSKNPFELIEALLQPRTNLLPTMIRTVYIQSAFKVLVYCLHLFFVPRQTTTSSSLDDLSQDVFGLNPERELREGQALVKEEDSSASFDSDQNEEFVLRSNNRIGKDVEKVNGGNGTVTHGQVSYADSAKEPFTRESVVYVIDMLKTAMVPLSGSDEVEVQERARNVLGLLELLQQETSGWLTEKSGSFKEEDIHAFKIIEMLHSALSQELGPVSMTSQERVPIPEGFILNDSLADLDNICGDVLSPPSGSFSMGDRLFTENYGGSSLDLHKKEDSEQSTESTSLLAQHRKRHGLYYLQAERNESTSNDYPPANDPQSADTTNDGARDLLMITEKSLPSRTKQSRSKMRPVVIKLDEKDDKPVSTVKPWRDTDQDELSGAVRSILLGEEDKPVSSKSKSSGVGTSSSRRSKQRSHVKERDNSPMDNDENKEGNNQKDKKKSHRHSRNKTRHRADLPLNVVAQTPVIPDFLL